MLKEVTIERGLVLLRQGYDIKCLAPGGTQGKWEGYVPGRLRDLVDGVICFVDTEEQAQKSSDNRRAILDDGKILALYTSGWTLSKIADEFGTSVPTIRKRLDIAQSRAAEKFAEGAKQ